ncbi:Rhodanese-like domain-containing protein [Zostera marina]|uniref:Rhodanese-like domain-containing protein n=1 Tax=Zostera marina TaxID=29655 RepID=A0A0K9Q5X4_ZOSMR|nr:Rhodanese-like domain-containing protein [Zostera marina]
MAVIPRHSPPLHLLLLVVASFVLIPTWGRSNASEPISSNVETIDIHTARSLLIGAERNRQRHLYLDVRTRDEFYNGHVENAINIPYILFTSTGKVKNLKFVEQVMGVMKKDDYILVGCLTGVRSLEASEVLTKAGFKYVKNVGGGYAAWVDSGFDVVNEPKNEL